MDRVRKRYKLYHHRYIPSFHSWQMSFANDLSIIRYCRHLSIALSKNNNKSKEGCKDQESIQSSITEIMVLYIGVAVYM